MGFNLLGVAIDKEFADKQALYRELQIGDVEITNEHEVFENAVSSYSMDDDAVFITETASGSLITFGTSIDFTTIKTKKLSENGNVLLFVIGDTVGMYILLYAKNGKIIRYINYNQGEKIADKGHPLPIEEHNKDISEIIFALIGQIIGKSFWDLEPGHPSVMFKIR
jgi:hypothetical protein